MKTNFRFSIVFILLACATAPMAQAGGRPLPPEEAPMVETVATAVYLPIVHTPRPRNGAAWAWYGWRNPNAAEILNIELFHHWGTRPVESAPAGFVQHIWCDRHPSMDWLNGTNLLQKAASDIPADYDGPILFYNEPDYRNQCERTPRQAASAYKQIREMFPNAILIGPQVSDQDYRAGWPWLRQFYNLLMGWQVPLPDKAAIHTYMGEDPQLIIDSLFALLDDFPESATAAWVTEFGARRPGMVTWMLETYQADPRIETWFYFAPQIWEDTSLKQLALLDDDGNLTAVGRAYVEALK